MSGVVPRASRLAFGRVAELYDRARPSYPAAAIDDVVEFAGAAAGDEAVEVGAGTGKATELLAWRGLSVTALEPDPAMAAVARVRCADLPLVRIVESEFESWRPPHAVRLLFSAQAWHWIDPGIRYAHARSALLPGGALAAVWTLPSWEDVAVRDRLREAYASAAPAMAPDFPMHPASRPDDLAGDWCKEIDGAGGFEPGHVREHRWTRSYAPSAYTDLLQTHQDHIRLAPERRHALLASVAEVIEGHGGTLTMTFRTCVCLARRL